MKRITERNYHLLMRSGTGHCVAFMLTAFRHGFDCVQ